MSDRMSSNGGNHFIYDQRRRYGAYGAPANAANVAKGANFGKVQEWADKNKTLLYVAGAALVAFLAYWIYQRSKRGVTGGAAVASAPASQTPAAPATKTAPQVVAKAVPQVAPPQMAPQMVPVTNAVPSSCAMGGVPKPYNVFQDDLVGANDMTMGPGVVPFSAGGAAGVPIDFAGQCSGVNPSAVWQSTQLLPSNCGQALEGTSDWAVFAPSNYQVTNFLAAGQLYGNDTQMSTLKNASLQLRPEPQIPGSSCSQVPFGQSSWIDSNSAVTDYSFSLIA